MRADQRTPKTASSTTVTSADTRREPRHPRRLEKNRNTLLARRRGRAEGYPPLATANRRHGALRSTGDG
jgi:hypothetical protein